MIDRELLLQMLAIESTSGKEREKSEFLSLKLLAPGCTLERFEVGDGTENLLFCWGKPEIVFCTHMDTVPPYIAPSEEELPGGDVRIWGRGSCDANGQIAALHAACLELQRRGAKDFALLLLSGEETGSFGAKAFRTQHPGGDTVIVGEPTDGCMVSASKGTKSFSLHFKGRAFHSGYPQMGDSAVLRFNDFINRLRAVEFPLDPLLGETTWNIGLLSSPNPQNIISDSLVCRLYFRTTFASDDFVQELMASSADDMLEVTPHGGDTPMRYTVLDGFPQKTVAFGSDAPQLTNFRRKVLCGAGSILVAHRPEESILLSELEEMAGRYVDIYYELNKNKRTC